MTKRETVIPGELVAKGKDAGKNTYKEDDSVYSSIYGFKEEKDDYVAVLPADIKYRPKEGDKIIGIVEDVDFKSWYLEINCPYDAKLPVS